MERPHGEARARVWLPNVLPPGWQGIWFTPFQGKLYTLGGVQSKTVDQYDVESDTWANFFPSIK